MGYSRSVTTSWSNGSNPKPSTVKRCADYFGVDVSYFYEEEIKEALPVGATIMIPVIGSVKAGYGSEAIEEYTGEYFPVFSDAIHGNTSEYKVLKATGDSMYPFVLDGDYLLVHTQCEAESGEIVVAILSNGESTVKRLSDDGKVVRLVPANPMYPPIELKNGDRIWGKVTRVERVL